VSEAPSRIRPARPDDLDAVVDLLNDCDVAEVGAPDTTREDVENDWAMDGFDLGSDAWVAEGAGGGPAGGDLVGYAYVGDQHRTGQLEADFWVRPGRREPGLARRLLALAERRGATIAAERGYAAPSLHVYCIGTNRAKRDLLTGHGYTLLRTIYRMAADLTLPAAGRPAPAPPLTPPGGIEIRPFRAGVDERVMYVTMKAAFADHFQQSDEPFDAWKTRLLGHADFDPGLWLLAWEGDEAVGAVIAYDHGDLGWVRGLGVLRPWRRRGLGGALLAHVLAEFARRGQPRVELGVDAEAATQPLRVYERAGLHVTSTYELYAKNLGS
jgi:mycothiol synthase